MKFFVGLHHPARAIHFERAFISVNALRRVDNDGNITKQRRSDFPANKWIMDSGAFTEVFGHGRYRTTVEDYAWQIKRWSTVGELVAACAQDWMCEAKVLKVTGLTVREHQARTVDRFVALKEAAADSGVYIMPVLQGFTAAEYVDIIGQYERAGEPLPEGALVGVGSVCKRNGNPAEVEAVLTAILDARPDLRLHGFGLKLTALKSEAIRNALSSSDSMAWSFAAMKQGRDSNSWHEAARFVERVEDLTG